MKNINKFKILLAILAIHIYFPASAEPLGSDRPLALTHVNILPMDQDRLLEDYTLIIRDGKIDRLGPSSSLDIPSEAEAIDSRLEEIVGPYSSISDLKKTEQ